ncbi:hypothetical protein lam_923 [Candidatus Liberibacter americanus str. Sao Paulo]|uniref:Uncharacterized protein n=1 Tax=Candidatus Liberibacter americanus str. Sao Paulo TaxID=1261131 RepID=U6B8T0_9HYPH|nr:hypothetical protein lam_923 [Candidatus Liberibacter americanus str. Sao Paulo]
MVNKILFLKSLAFENDERLRFETNCSTADAINSISLLKKSHNNSKLDSFDAKKTSKYKKKKISLKNISLQ